MAAPPPPSTHRLATVSLTQALTAPTTPLPSNILPLDTILHGGFPRSCVSEICGPPGIGKTSILLHLVSSALRSGSKVLWLSCSSHPYLSTRLPQDLPFENMLLRTTPTLAHLLVVLQMLTEEVGLLVVDDVGGVFATMFPPGSETGCRYVMMGAVMGHLGRIAAVKGAVVAVSVQMATRVVPGVGGVLQSSLGAVHWTGGLAVRVQVVRRGGERVIRVLKRGGRECEEEGAARLEGNVWSGVEEEWVGTQRVGTQATQGRREEEARRVVDELAELGLEGEVGEELEEELMREEEEREVSDELEVSTKEDLESPPAKQEIPEKVIHYSSPPLQHQHGSPNVDFWEPTGSAKENAQEPAQEPPSPEHEVGVNPAPHQPSPSLPPHPASEATEPETPFQPSPSPPRPSFKSTEPATPSQPSPAFSQLTPVARELTVPPPATSGKRKRENTGFAAGIIPDSDDDGGFSSDDG